MSSVGFCGFLHPLCYLFPVCRGDKVNGRFPDKCGDHQIQRTGLQSGLHTTTMPSWWMAIPSNEDSTRVRSFFLALAQRLFPFRSRVTLWNVATIAGFPRYVAIPAFILTVILVIPSLWRREYSKMKEHFYRSSAHGAGQ